LNTMKIQRARKGKYRQERKFWEKLSEKFSNHPYVKIPTK
jgi:hypothetical protein